MNDRPSVRVPLWSSDVNYPAGLQPWAGTATKIDPGAGAEGDGAVPDAQLAAQHYNFEQNAMDQWLTYLQDVPLRNWVVDSSSFGTDSLEDCGFIPNLGLWIFGRKNDKYLLSRGEPKSFLAGTLTTAGGKSGLLRLFANDGTGTAMFTVDGSSQVTDPDIWIYNGTTFTRKALAPFAATFLAHGLTHIPSLDRWVLVGAEGGSLTPKAYTSDDDGANWTGRTVPTAGALQIYDIARRLSSFLLVAVGTDGTTDDVAWTTTDGVTWTDHAITGATNTRFIAYADKLDVFMTFSLSGATATAYTSSDGGSTWSASGALPGDIVAVTGLACTGAAWLCMAETDYGHEIFLSQDVGATWSPLAMLSLAAGPDPAGQTLTSVQPLKHLMGRFVALFTDGTAGRLAMSLGS
jgi:hypothetical protein